MNKDIVIFGNKTVEDLFKDIYKNSTKKSKQIQAMISVLQPLITNTKEATMIVPLIKDYLDVDIRNDEHLIKLAAIVQRMASNTDNDTSGFFGLSEEEIEEIKKEAEQQKIEDTSIKQLDNKSEDIISDIKVDKVKEKTDNK